MFGLVDQYFVGTTAPEANELRRGHLCLAPVFYLFNNLSVIELLEPNPQNERLNKYRLLSNPPENTLFNHTPVHELRLASDEKLLAVKATLIRRGCGDLKKGFYTIGGRPSSFIPR